MFSETRNNIFCRVWYIIYREKKSTVCAFLALFYHLPGMILQLVRRRSKGSWESRRGCFSSVLLAPYVLYVLLENIKSTVK